MENELEESKAGCKNIVWGTTVIDHGLNDSGLDHGNSGKDGQRQMDLTVERYESQDLALTGYGG